MLDPLVHFLLSLRESLGGGAFLGGTLLFSLVLCLFVIPWVTDHMVDSVAGLAGKHLGPKHRTLAINASTNSPELFLMLVSLAILNVGGVATPLGSNFANLYLMFLVAPVWVVTVWYFKARKDDRRKFVALLRSEKRLVAWHFVAAAGLFATSATAFYLLTGKMPIGGGSDPSGGEPAVRGLGFILAAAGICLVAILVMVFFDRRLKRGRPELFACIDSSDENPSWLVFLSSTAGLIACSLAMNVVFLAWTEAYRTSLSAVLGAGVFTGLHYFAGALITSLPELTVAIANFRLLRSPDLNTALGSASYSNFTNLGIATFGMLLAALMILCGVKLAG